jgi:indolepyruvate ferredoxin oxidoreductase
MPASFTRNPDLVFPGQAMEQAITEAAGEGKSHFIDATTLATALLGDSIASNLFMVGYAFQKGLLPLSAEAIERAIEINGTAIDFNKQAFLWGRRAAHDLAAVEQVIKPTVESMPIASSLEDIISRRKAMLTDYQNARYAKRYEALVRRVAQVEAETTKGRSGLAEAVARYYAKLLAYKDEYEVARLYIDGNFMKQVDARFEGDYTLEFHLAPPLLAKSDPATGHPKKKPYGPWMLKAFTFLAKLKGLRGTPRDLFGYSTERKLEQQLIKDYEARVETLLTDLNHDNYAYAVELAALPEQVRGYGHIKEAHLKRVRAREQELLALFRNPPQAAAA